jgi:DNA-binding transcriptional regulator YiaG
MKTAADYMTQKQLRALNSEVKTYRMGSPMNWEEFSTMPDDLKKMYIKNLRKKFNVPDEELAMAMGVELAVFTEDLKSIKLSPRISEDRDWYGTDECGRFQTWWVVAEEEK